MGQKKVIYHYVRFYLSLARKYFNYKIKILNLTKKNKILLHLAETMFKLNGFGKCFFLNPSFT